MNQWKTLLDEVHQQADQIKLGGGEKAIARQHSKGRLTARERISKLIDPDSDFLEVGLWAAWGMYEQWGGCPSACVVCGVGKVAGRLVMIVANDATIKAGAFFPATCKKLLRAQRIAMANHLPTIYLVDSAGVFLPLQDEIFPDEDDFGRIFFNNSVMSAKGIPQTAAIMGNCVAGGGYLPVLCDRLLMTEGSGLYLAGPALVKSAIGQEVSSEELGGAEMHAQISGTIDFREPDDEACIVRLRELAEHLPTDQPMLPFQRLEAKEPSRPVADVYDIASVEPGSSFDVRELIDCVVDGDSVQEYKPEFGQSIVCSYARIGGFPVGVIANQHQPTKSTDRGLQFGGVVYDDSADKTARFIMDCNQNWMPLVFLQDVMGFMVGRDSEHAGIIRSGAKLVNVLSNSRVPKLTVITGGSYGAGNYAMCGKAFDPQFIFAWPNAKYAVMGGKQAASTIVDVQVRSLKRQGKELDASDLEELRETVTQTYDNTTDIRYGASRGWVDGIIDPADTRDVLIRSLEAVTKHCDGQEMKFGVLQV